MLLREYLQMMDLRPDTELREWHSQVVKALTKRMKQNQLFSASKGSRMSTNVNIFLLIPISVGAVDKDYREYWRKYNTKSGRTPTSAAVKDLVYAIFRQNLLNIGERKPIFFWKK